MILAPQLQTLVYESTNGFQTACREFVLEYVFSNVDEEDADDEDGELRFFLHGSNCLQEMTLKVKPCILQMAGDCLYL